MKIIGQPYQSLGADGEGKSNTDEKSTNQEPSVRTSRDSDKNSTTVIVSGDKSIFESSTNEKLPAPSKNASPSLPHPATNKSKNSGGVTFSSIIFSAKRNATESDPSWAPLTSGVRKLNLNLTWTSSKTLDKHFRDHANEFPEYRSKKEYLLAAIKFWEKPILSTGTGQLADLIEKRGTRGPPRSENDVNIHKIYRYERSTGILSSIQLDPINPGQLLLTFFKPRWGKQDRLTKASQYFLEQ